jgi:uncharacterized membrane protein
MGKMDATASRKVNCQICGRAFWAENDYKVNLKAELEIRHLHEKIDHLLRKQYNRLFEIQQIQIELLEEISQRKRGAPRESPRSPDNSPT